VNGIAYLDGQLLQRCLTAGLQRLIDQREYLNRINVFPVPDGDTGNNLAHAAAAGQQALIGNESNAAGVVLAELATAVLDAAQGNSGALLAQFLQGFADSGATCGQLDTKNFAEALAKAADATRQALDNPREGTIISVIDACAVAGNSHADCGDFMILLPAIRDAAVTALAATTTQLRVLQDAGVVDAGAAGYSAFIEGWTDYLLSGSASSLAAIPRAPEIFDPPAAHAIDDLRFRFCTECMLAGPALDAARVRNTLHALGDSIVVAGSSQRLRIHIHTDEPEKVFRQIEEFGEVQGTKADDMLGQAKSLARHNRTVAIVTDSAADLPDALITELDIHVVPLRITFGSHSYLDKIGMGPAEFNAALQTSTEQPGTSQPTQGDLRRMYDFLLTHFREVLSINLGSKLSGTYQAAVAAAAALPGGERIQVMDSANVSAGQGLIVKRAAELAAAGVHGAALQAAVQHEIESVRTFALVTDLGNAVRGGRLHPLVKRIADWLRLTPVLVNTGAGTVGVHGFIPGRKRLPERFANYIARAVGTSGQWDIAIASAAVESAETRRLKSALSARLKNVRSLWATDIGPAFAVHAGPTALVVALRKRSEEEE